MRELVYARLVEKTLLSAAAQCYHLTFAWAGEGALSFEPGQFFSCVAEDPTGKSYTRAYSIASAAFGSHFDLCVNRVKGGFFSNHLCDLHIGARIGCHGPHGLFTLKQPLAEMLWIAGGTGIAPMRGFAQRLFGVGDPVGEKPRLVTLIYQAEDEDQLFYDAELRSLAAKHSAFKYQPVISAASKHEALESAIAEFASTAQQCEAGTRGADIVGQGAGSRSLAYVCGLAELVKPARAHLLSLGWEKQRILFERYD